MDVALQAPLSMGFSRQEYRSGLPLSSPGDLLNPMIEPACPTSNLHWQVARFCGKPAFTTSATWESPKSGNQTSDSNQPRGPGENQTLLKLMWVSVFSNLRKLVTDAAAAAATKLLQSCPTLCDPIDGSPPESSVPGILQARTLEWVAISFSNAWKWKVKVKLLSHVWLFATAWTAAYQAPPSMGFSRQEYWSGVPLPSPGFFLFLKKKICITLVKFSPASCVSSIFSAKFSIFIQIT